MQIYIHLPNPPNSKLLPIIIDKKELPDRQYNQFKIHLLKRGILYNGMFNVNINNNGTSKNHNFDHERIDDAVIAFRMFMFQSCQPYENRA